MAHNILIVIDWTVGQTHHSLLVVLTRHGEADVLGDVVTLALFVSLDSHFVELENVGLFSGGAPQNEPVLHCVEAESLRLLRHLRTLDPALAISAEGRCILSQLQLLCLLAFFCDIRLLENQRLKWFFLVNATRFILSKFRFLVSHGFEIVVE